MKKKLYRKKKLYNNFHIPATATTVITDFTKNNLKKKNDDLKKNIPLVSYMSLNRVTNSNWCEAHTRPIPSLKQKTIYIVLFYTVFSYFASYLHFSFLFFAENK